MDESGRAREDQPLPDRSEPCAPRQPPGAPLGSLEPVVAVMLDACPEPAVVIDLPRRIVLANDKVSALGERRPGEVTGLRLGDLLQCAHADDSPGGCGTTPFCTVCGARSPRNASTGEASAPTA